jgi:Phosphate-selective porin O and P
MAAAPAQAYVFDERVEVYGYTQLWATIWEQMQDAKGLFQRPSGDEAADAVSGFRLAKARLGIRLAHPPWNLSLHAQVKLDHDFALLDADLAWAPAPWFSLHAGQFKIPGTYEALLDDRRLDFIVRADITTALADFALSRSQHPVSLLYGSSPLLRDLGVAAKGEVGGRSLTGRYFLMVSNGLGANTYFGGLTSKEYFLTNRAQFFYGGRLELTAASAVTLGAFGSYNRHDNIVFNSGRAVYDINRRMVGGDLRVAVPGTGLRLGMLGGGGRIYDDFNGDGKTDLRYSGWAASAVWDVFPALRLATSWAIPQGHALELAGRFERFDQEVDESGLTSRRERTTVGVSYVAATYIKLQLEYILRRGDDPAAVAPNLANDAFLANLQAAF